MISIVKIIGYWFFIKFEYLIISYMIQFSQLLQQSPETLRRIVKENINNKYLESLITETKFLQQFQVQLTAIEEVPFFIKHIFKIIRDPSQNELQVLKEYMCNSHDENLTNLAKILIEDSKEISEETIDMFFTKIRKLINEKEWKEIKILIRKPQGHEFESFKNLISLLFEYKEDRIFKNNEYRNQVFQAINSAFKSLSKCQQYCEQFIDILACLLKQKIMNNSDYLFLLLIIIKISQHYRKFSKILINKLNNKQKVSEISLSFINISFFSLFEAHFKTDLYYNSKNLSTFKQMTEIADKIYDLFSQDNNLVDMDWIVILTLPKYLTKINPNQIQRFHISVSLMRQLFFSEPEIISELLILTISSIIEEIHKTDIQKIQDILTILTPKQIKYLILKLSESLTPAKKKQIMMIIFQSNLKILQVMAFHFCLSAKLSKQQKQQFEQFIFRRQERWKYLAKDINESRYNSLQKQLSNFNQRYLYIISNQLSGSVSPTIFQLSSQLRYYSKLLQNDQFSQQYWLNQEKIKVFMESKEPIPLKVELITDFISEKQIFNLSSMMLINQLMKQLLQNELQNISQPFLIIINRIFKTAIKTIENDFFASNICIALQNILLTLKLKLPIDESKNILTILESKNTLSALQLCKYNKISYLCQLIGLTFLENIGELSKIRQYINILPFYRQVICKECITLNLNEFTQKIFTIYQSLQLLPTNSHYMLRQMRSKNKVRKMICHEMKFPSIKENIKEIGEVFIFEMPIYKQQIVVLTYISHSPEDNYYFKNHFIPYLYQEYARILSLTCQKINKSQIHHLIFEICINLLSTINNGDTFSHGQSFYKSLNKSQIVYILLTKTNLSYLQPVQIRDIINSCLKITEKDNYPFLRQYIQVILCRAYCVLNMKQPKNQMRKHFMEIFNHNINIGVPLALTLGYELSQFCKSSQKSVNQEQIQSIHQLLVKFISCHTAYLRVICQYYLYQYLELVPSQDPFLINIHKFWSEDKDSQKLFQNISIVIEGFRQGVQTSCDFLGFERVEEYPSNRVKLQIYGCLSRFYSESILNEIIRDVQSNSQFYNAVCDAVSERYQHINSLYLREINNFFNFQNKRTIKSNMKRQNNQQNKVTEPSKKVKKQSKAKLKNKKVPKHPSNQTEQIQIHNLQKEEDYLLYNKFCQYEEILQLSHWYRDNLNPKIIIIATLLEKVHNFGHILRTLHQKNAMLVVPSQMPLLHKQCKQLIPMDCDVKIVEIRNRDLQKFIILMKSLGYPLVALEQCSRSVSVEQAVFPQKFMLLLGNQRIGAPASLLNEGDLLVQIPQIGKIRSLNVHVSMVLCLWQYICKQQ